MTELTPFADLSGLGGTHSGTHYSHFYATRDDLEEAVIPFITEGLRKNERCLWVTSPPLDATAGIAALRRRVPDLDRHFDQGQITVIDHHDWYLAAGGFDASRVIEGWIAWERAALTDGYAGLRITGNTMWLETPKDFADFADYEAKLHRALIGRKIVCLCSYAVDRCSAATVLDVVRNHDFVMVRRGGQWDVVESSPVAAAKAELARELQRKDELLSEIHHRVKNNLQIVSSMLTLKAAEFAGPKASEALDDTLTRIRAMALVHEMLYQQDAGDAIDFGAYLRRLASTMTEAYNVDGRVAIEIFEACAPLRVTLDDAVPLAIATTEAVTNALKHAFPAERAGRITIRLDQAEEMVITVTDDGCGFAPASARPPRMGAGLGLIHALAHQVGGRTEYGPNAEGGFRVTITAPVG